MTGVTITYEKPGQPPLCVATVYENRGLLHQVAKLAVRQAVEAAIAISQDDPVLGAIRAGEVRQLRETLLVLLPELGPLLRDDVMQFQPAGVM